MYALLSVSHIVVSLCKQKVNNTVIVYVLYVNNVYAPSSMELWKIKDHHSSQICLSDFCVSRAYLSDSQSTVPSPTARAALPGKSPV